MAKRIYTWEELERMEATEITNLCKEYGMSALSMRTFTLKQKMAFIRAVQITK